MEKINNILRIIIGVGAICFFLFALAELYRAFFITLIIDIILLIVWLILDKKCIKGNIIKIN